MVCVFPKDHPLEAKRRVSVKDVLSHRLVAFDPETVPGRIIDDWFRKQHLERKVSVEVRSGHTACALVASGAGVAFVDNLTARAHTSGTIVSRPVSRSPVFAIYLVTNRNRPISVVAKQLSIEVEKCFKDLRRDNPATFNR